jgi:LysR family transcriptional regulator for metE and metH
MLSLCKEKLSVLVMRNVSLKQLRIVTAVAQSGRIARAATLLGVTAPAITLQLQLLEKETGLPLFERSRGGMRLTEGGRLFLRAARQVEQALQECGEAVKALKGLAGGKVMVGLVSTAKYFAPRALASFGSAHPEIEMQVAIGNRERTLTALRNLELDLAITGYPPEDMAFEKKVIGEHPHVIIVPPGHPLAIHRKLTLSQLASEVFLVREPGSGTRRLMEQLFVRAGIAPRIGMEIDSNETIKQAVMAGLGIAVISAHTVTNELEEGRLALLNVEGLPVIRKWYVVKHTQKRLLPAAAALWSFLCSDGRRFLPASLSTSTANRKRRTNH